MERTGPKPGAQRGNPPRYNEESGGTWRPNPTLEAPQAAKLSRAMKATNNSASGIINELLARMEVDEEGRPLWADPPRAQGTLVEMPAERKTGRAA